MLLLEDEPPPAAFNEFLPTKVVVSVELSSVVSTVVSSASVVISVLSSSAPNLFSQLYKSCANSSLVILFFGFNLPLLPFTIPFSTKAETAFTAQFETVEPSVKAERLPFSSERS